MDVLFWKPLNISMEAFVGQTISHWPDIEFALFFSNHLALNSNCLDLGCFLAVDLG